MSEIRWTPEAVADLLEIHDYLARDNPAAAEDVSQRIYDSINRLIAVSLARAAGRNRKHS